MSFHAPDQCDQVVAAKGKGPVVAAVEPSVTRHSRKMVDQSPESHALKHTVEDILGAYVANGERITVAVYLNAEHEVSGPNACFAIELGEIDDLHLLQKNAKALREAGIMETRNETIS